MWSDPAKSRLHSSDSQPDYWVCQMTIVSLLLVNLARSCSPGTKSYRNWRLLPCCRVLKHNTTIDEEVCNFRKAAIVQCLRKQPERWSFWYRWIISDLIGFTYKMNTKEETDITWNENIVLAPSKNLFYVTVVFCLYIIRDFKFHDALSIMYVLCLSANISQKNK